MNGPRAVHIARLRDALTEIPKLAASISSWTPEFTAWMDRLLQSLEAVFGKANGYTERMHSLRWDEARTDLDPRLWGSHPGTFAEDFRSLEQILKDALEDLPAEASSRRVRTVGDPSLMVAAQRLYNPDFPKGSVFEGLPASTAAPTAAQPSSAPDPRKVFVVHGRNESVRSALFDFLRSLDLSPMEWSQALALTGKASPYVGEVLEAAFANARAVIVLLTGRRGQACAKALVPDRNGG